jgi:hypothetical protein
MKDAQSWFIEFLFDVYDHLPHSHAMWFFVVLISV